MELRILGPVELRDVQGADLSIGGPKPRALLALLALHEDETVSTDRLADLLWGADAPGSPRASIQSYVSRLRAVLPGAAIEHAGGGYRLVRDGLEVDLRRAEQLADAGRRLLEDRDPVAAVGQLTAALTLWRGRPLAGLGEIPLVEDLRPGLEQLRLATLEQRFAAELAAGRDVEIIPELETLVAEHPFRERFRGHLMLALYRAGRQADALAVFRDTREVLIDELGVEPGDELSDIHQRILAQDPGLSRPTDGPSRHRAWAAHGMAGAGLAGRQREVATLHRLLEEAASGRARLALVGGEAGIGKTSLLDHVAGRARDEGIRVLIGGCTDTASRTLPYAPFAQVLRALGDNEGAARVPHLIARRAGEDLAPLLPELAGSAGASDDRDLQDMEQVRPRVFGAVLHALTTLSRQQPLLLGLEDLHWGDTSTLDLLGFLVRNLERERVCVIATFRTDEATAAARLDDLLAELPRLPNVTRLDLAPFTEQETAAQIQSILGHRPDPASARRLTRRSGGNPFYIEQLVAADDGEELPATLRDVVRGRLADLTAEATEVLVCAAVLGREVDHRRLAQIVPLQSERLSRAIRELVDRHLLLIDQDTYRLRHALVQEVVYDGLLPGRRITVHRRIAEALADEHAGTGHGDGALAYHWHAAGEAEQALEASLSAAQRARTVGAFAESRQHYERALDLWDAVRPEHDRTAVLSAAAEVAGHAGRAEARVDHLKHLLRQMGPEAGPEARAAVGSRLARALFDLGDDASALREAALASRLVEDRQPTSVQVRAMSNHASLLLTSVRADRRQAIRPARAAVDAARHVGDRAAEAQARERLGSALAWTGAPDEGVAELQRARDMAVETEDPAATMAAYFSLFFVLHQLTRRYQPARRIADEALSWLDLHEDRWAGSAGLLTILAYEPLRTGRWDRAGSLLDRVARQHLEGGQRMSFHTVRATLRWMQGRTREAIADVAHVRQAGPGARLHQDLFPLAAELAAESGDLGQTRAIAREHLRFDVRPSEQPMKGATLRALVRAEVDAALRASGSDRAQHVSSAQDALDRLRDLLRRFPPRAASTFQLERPGTYRALAEAELSRVVGPDPQAWERLRGATAYAYWQTYIGWRHAEALLASGRAGEGSQALRSVCEHADQVGADGLRRQVQALDRTT